MPLKRGPDSPTGSSEELERPDIEALIKYEGDMAVAGEVYDASMIRVCKYALDLERAVEQLRLRNQTMRQLLRDIWTATTHGHLEQAPAEVQEALSAEPEEG